MDEGINYKSRPDYTYEYYDYPILEECANYSLNGIINFLQNEWTKIEIKTVQWDVERAELQAKIAYLQGERKSQDNLKLDLIRRIKMLEYALKQERKKVELLGNNQNNESSVNSGVEGNLNNDENVVIEEFDDSDIYFELSKNNQKINDENAKWKDEKLRLRKMFMDAPENGDHQARLQPESESTEDDSSNDSKKTRGKKRNKLEDLKSSTSFIDGSFKFLSNDSEFEKDTEKSNTKFEMPLFDSETEEALAEFDCLVNHIQQKAFTATGNKSTQKYEESEWSKIDQTVISKMKEMYIQERGPGSRVSPRSKSSSTSHEDEDPNSESSNDHDYGSPSSGNNSDLDSISDSASSSSDDEAGSVIHTRLAMSEQPLSLGDLANLAVVNEAGIIIADPENPSHHLADRAGHTAGANKPTGSVSVTDSSSLLKKSWQLRFSLRSHFDCVRAALFHPQQPLLVTGSEDHTLKLWNLTKTVPSKKGSAALDVEPIYTYRGHTSPVLCLCMDDKFLYSGSLDGQIRIWVIPATPMDPYDSYNTGLSLPIYFVHSEAVWALCCDKAGNQLLSMSAEGSLRCWTVDPATLMAEAPPGSANNRCLLHHYSLLVGADFMRPSCMTLVMATVLDEASDLCTVLGFGSGHSGIVNTTNGVFTTRFPLRPTSETAAVAEPVATISVDCVASHPTKAISILGYSDGFICCYDNVSSELLTSISAHQDGVSSLSIDLHGTFLLSASHDCQVRVWNLSTWSCLQEITCHRRRHHESVWNVIFHPTKSLFATAGADMVVKVFV